MDMLTRCVLSLFAIVSENIPKKGRDNLEGNAHGVDAKNLDSFDPKNVVTFVTQKLYCKPSLLHSSAQRSLHKLVHILGLSD